ncbi:MAG: cysteine desulfurase family protein [Reyranellaceae bacterium]
MIDAMARAGNPSSVHAAGRAARHLVESAREQVARSAGVAASEVVFTGSGTEANNLALRGVGGSVVISTVEHESIMAARPDAITVPVDRNGIVDLPALDTLVAEYRPSLVSVMLANNETGAIQPIEEVAQIAHRAGALVHCDAVQAFGKIAVDARALDVDLLSLSAHKIGGPLGVGALVVRGNLALEPLLRGGGQERRRRAGTENVAGIAGFGVAAAAVSDHLMRVEASGTLRDDLERRLSAIMPGAVVYAAGARRLPNTTCVGMPGVTAETQLMAFDLAGIAISAGAACSSGKVAGSRVLRAMGVSEEEARCAIRVSFGRGNSVSDVERFVSVWTALASRRSANGGTTVRAA